MNHSSKFYIRCQVFESNILNRCQCYVSICFLNESISLSFSWDTYSLPRNLVLAIHKLRTYYLAKDLPPKVFGLSLCIFSSYLQAFTFVGHPFLITVLLWLSIACLDISFSLSVHSMCSTRRGGHLFSSCVVGFSFANYQLHNLTDVSKATELYLL